MEIIFYWRYWFFYNIFYFAFLFALINILNIRYLRRLRNFFVIYFCTKSNSRNKNNHCNKNKYYYNKKIVGRGTSYTLYQRIFLRNLTVSNVWILLNNKINITIIFLLLIIYYFRSFWSVLFLVYTKN